MSIFKKSQDKIEAEKLYALISDKTKNYTIDEIKETIKKQGYSDTVSSMVIKTILDNKLPLKNDLKQSKEDVLKDLSSNVKKVNDKSSRNKVGFFTKAKNFFKRSYFFFEDNYYKMIDSVSKVIPLNKLTDKIDKVFPSFILFILILALLVYLIFSGSLSFSKSWTLAVEVYDPSNAALNNASVSLYIKDKLISSQTTDVFGETVFQDFKSKKQNILLKVEKENYKTSEHIFRINKNNLRQKVYLPIDTDSPLIPSNEEEEREIIFVENNNILITNSTLNVTFTCSNTEKNPTPRTTLVTSGKVKVNTPKSCGSLRVSVTSNSFSSITNQVVGEDNKVILTRINNERGKLSFSVKTLSGSAIPGSEAIVYNNSSSSALLPLDTKTTDLYGLGEFSLEPKQYLLTISKSGYLTHPLKGPLTVTKDNTTNTEVVLFTLQELLDFNCSNPKYSQFCVNEKIDCQNQHLKPFLLQKTDGTCTIGRPGYISVTLKDANTSEPVFADITLESKLKGSDQNFTFTEYISQDTNHHVFNVIDFYDYKVRVLNSEDNGYLQPDPVLVTSIDSNIVITLEFSSSLNSGKIGVNVKNNNSNISNARVYLYRKVDGDFSLVSPIPKLTNQFGDVNFDFQRANRDYYAYAVHNVIDKQGTSNIKKLDVNSFLKLDVDLEDIPKILNLKISPNIAYTIDFYDSLSNPVTEYVTVDKDTNKQYYFTTDIQRVYAVISSQGYTTYQTELITLIPDQEIFKQINLSSLSACADTKLEVLGLYDKTGVNSISNIDFIENTLDKEYRLKLKYTSCNNNVDIKYAHIRTGNQIFIDDDYIFLVSEEIISEDIGIKRGYKFSQEHIPDFNMILFSQNYTSDRQYDFSGNKYKWLEIDFIDLKPNILEFSVNIKFKQSPIAPIDFYKLSYRSLATKYQEKYSFDPSLPASWNDMPVYPEGYFYSKTNNYQIPFLNTDYIYLTKLKDWNNSLLESYADGYAVSIETPYKYDLEYLYLKDSSRNGFLKQASVYTNNNLEYSSYGYLSSLGNSSFSDQGSNNPLTGFIILNNEEEPPLDPGIYYHISVDDLNYTLGSFDINRGYSLKTYTIFKPKGFFENTSVSKPKITSDLFNNFPTASTIVYSYYSDVNFVFEITTSAYNNIIVGENNVSFKVLNNYGAPVSDVIVRYQVIGDEIINLGKTNAQGILSDQNIYLPITDMDKNINFYFIFSPEFGFVGNTVTRSKLIESGFSILQDKLNSSVDYYKLNNKVIFGNINKENYTLTKSNTLFAVLEELSFVGSSNIFKVDNIKSKMMQDNNIPLTISSPETEITTSLFMSDNLDVLSGVILSLYRNDIKINNAITKIFDINNDVNINYLGNINFSVDYPKPFKGVTYNDANNFYNVEIIKEINPDINFNYNLTATNATIKNISIEGQAPSFLDQSVFNFSNYQNMPINPSGSLFTLRLKVNDSFSGSQDGILKLKFNILINGSEVSFIEEYRIKAFDKTSIVTISSVSSDLEIFCSTYSCSQSRGYGFKKNVSNYNINLKENVSLLPVDGNISVGSIPSLVISNQEVSRSLSFSSNYDNLSLDETSGNTGVYFNFNVLNINKDFNLSKPLNYKIIKMGSEYQSDITFDSCIGVGGQEVGDDIFILGYCQDQEESCRTGLSAVPKVFYNWGAVDLSTDLGRTWSDVCIADEKDLMSSRYACDSLQAMISIFYKIQNGVDGVFYIKLVNDGITDDFLKDFIDYINNDPTSLFAKFNLPRNTALFTDQAVEDGKFKVVINENTSLKTFEPGIYKVTVFGDVGARYKNTIDDKIIDIRLDRVASIPSTEITVFHYMPFNGSLKKNGTREGYGIKAEIQNDEPVIKVNSSSDNVDINYINVQNPINTLIPTNNNSLSGLKNTINSEGYILDLTRLQENFITLKYTPSYPITIYSHVACINDKNFSYDLLNNNNSLSNVIGNNFLKWNYNDWLLSDLKYTSQNVPRYILNNTSIDNNINIKTMLYLPTYLQINNLKFKLSDLGNDSNTTVFTKNNLQGIKTNTDITFSENDHVLSNNLENLQTIKGIFKYIEEEKACINKSPTKTYIKWIDANVNFTPQELEQIINNLPENYSCNVQNAGSID